MSYPGYYVYPPVPYPPQQPYLAVPVYPPSPVAGNPWRRSWHGQGGAYSPGRAFHRPITPPTQPPVYVIPDYPDGRRRSFDAAFIQPQHPYARPGWPGYGGASPHHSPYNWLPELPIPQIHTLLNGDSLPQHLHVDFSLSTLTGHRRTGIHLTVPLTAYELDQTATNPETLRLRIVCDAIPQWPLDISISGHSLSPSLRNRAAIPYITVGDVLGSIHQHLHKPITHEEWHRLNSTQETDVARAYTRRYKANTSVERQQRDRGQGVKRVDYLLKNFCFKGLVWVRPEDGVEKMKLLVGPPQ